MPASPNGLAGLFYARKTDIYQAAFFNFAQRARCAAAILFRPAAEIVRVGFAEFTTWPVVVRFAQRAFCAKLIFFRAAALITLRSSLGALPFELMPRKASATRCNFLISASTSRNIV
jgi:hypothetical protein